jgi:carbamoyltransferase
MPKRSVTVLGIHDGHDAGAALVRDGKVLAALQEERPRNIKHYSGTPEISIREVFKIAKMHPSEVNVVSIAGLVRTHAPIREDPIKVRIFERLSPYLASHSFAKLYTRILHKYRDMKVLKQILSQLGILQKEVVFVEHHLAHAATAYRTCPWQDEPILILTADGAGDGLSSTVNIGEDGQIQRVAESTYYDSLGNVFYSEVTRYLGMKPWDHEYKTMGLAPYGDPKFCVEHARKIIRVNPKRPLEFQNTIGAYCRFVQPKLKKILDGQRFDNIAAATQLHFEELITAWTRNAIKKTDVHKIACSGGLFLNVKANKRMIEMPEVDDAFFYPAAGDDGIPVGAALQAYYEYCSNEGLTPERQPLCDLYYGPAYSDQEIEQDLRKTGWIKKAEYYDEIDCVVGEQVANGKIIARFNGRLEWGPRALGNRSILADARDLKVIRKINFAIKHRDFWMPFAATILEDRMNEYLVNSRTAPYMILAFDTTDKREEIAAGIHPFDHTCRPQTLDQKWNPDYYKVLQEFQNCTGIGGLLNTSFNLHGYPVVCNPEQALWTLENSKLDGLALGNFLVMN